MSYAIIRNQKYKRENLKGIFRHNERKNENYSNKNIDKEKSHLNYSLKDPKYSYEKEFERIRKEYKMTEKNVEYIEEVKEKNNLKYCSEALDLIIREHRQNSDITTEKIVTVGTATNKMVDFLCMCLRYGVSFLVAGATSSGKTTLLNALLDTVPDGKRIFTIESGSRELSLVKKRDGKVVNNVVHTLSRPSDDEGLNIAQEDLVVASLRFDPDNVVVGEIRDSEAYSAVEASLTGHTVVSTIHALAADAAHTRLALLCQKKFPIKFETSLSQAAQAFPLVVFAHRLEDSNRKIMDISECIVSGDGNRQYKTLFRYAITENRIKNGKYVIKGHFEQPEIMSDSLKKRLLQYGAPADVLRKFETKGADYK